MFRVHGTTRHEVLGNIIHAEVDGPWNIELIQEYVAQLTPSVDALSARGPWAVIVEIRGASLCPPEAVEAIHQGVLLHAAKGRACTAYVIAPEVEGAGVTDVVWRSIYAGVMPFEIFETLDEALTWVRAHLDDAPRAVGH